MQNFNKIAVIGGTGKSGVYLVKELLRQNFKIKVLIRNPEKIPPAHPNMEVIIGDVLDKNALHELISGCGGLISTLGAGIPFSEPTIFTMATKLILEVLEMTKISRYIVVTGLNVDTEFDQKGVATKAATDWMYTNYPVSTKDRQLEYELLCASKLDWTLVRLPLIGQTDEAPEISVSLTDCPGQHISATSLAKFLIAALQNVSHVKEAPFIANVG
ncbi:NAD(P)-dependent oxidoreductase [Algoriphagus aquimarinus]|uniref:Putative NADH-flavin reductase n=1 Tax=Algoriphagus aquimarinus TaxID=237018 RepID=A0A1I1ART8_9BACT|nr:NAD(P)H-binding protein [Algoriphagus aquimarinus]SFB40775.1 Putative NADH-flavin reductase [Algoriphagus aquimarinus]|tara:strand:- start:10556 stop:11203 length:648 start_codon:yes stop_codon:yes gene_type:complete